MSAATQRGKASRIAPGRLIFIMGMVAWLSMPFITYRDLAWDTIPLLTAGEIVQHHPDRVYASEPGHPNDITPFFLDKWCEASGDDPRCRTIAVPYVNTPLVLPIAIGLAHIGRIPTALLFDLLSSLALVAGMTVLWTRLTPRVPRAGPALAAASILMIPMAMVPISIGQLSTLMFLSVCLGISGRTARRQALDALAWVAATIMKVTPAPLALLLVIRRRWRMLTIAAAAFVLLFVVSLFVAPFSIWGDFLRSTQNLDEIVRGNNELGPADNFYAGSVAWLLSQIIPGSQAEGIGAAGVQAICLIAGVVICVIGMRNTHDDNRWAVGYLALLWNTPLLWSHYLWVAFGAFVIALSFRSKVTDKMLAMLVVFAALLGFEGAGAQLGWANPILTPITLVALTVATLWVIVGHRALEHRNGRSKGRIDATGAGVQPTP